MSSVFEASTGNKIRIAVVDSGIASSHPALSSIKYSNLSVSIRMERDQMAFEHNIEDHVGHGTAICGIFARLIPDAEFIIIKIFQNKELQVESAVLIAALDYILRVVDCDIVHMSLGIPFSSAALYEKCVQLRQRGTLLVSAFDNAGAISYPAFYDMVIGVDADERLRHGNEFYAIFSHNLTILAKGGLHRVAWCDPVYILTRGSSFSAAYVTSYVAKMLASGIAPDDVPKQFSLISKKVAEIPQSSIPDIFKVPFQIQHAVIYPYNKEMHSLVNFADKLPFSISAICDSKYTGRVGKTISSLNGKNLFVVQSFQDVEWDKVDTLILGHVDSLESITNAETKEKILNICLQNHINVYSFDSIGISTEIKDKFAGAELKLYIPEVSKADFIRASMRKMYTISKPVICVFGTSSQQGKFTLQLGMRYIFSQKGYQVSQLGTEPSALLYGMDACFPFGYNSAVSVQSEEFISTVNWIVHEIDIKNPDSDLIISGSQSGTTPAVFANLSHFPIPEILFAMAVMADAAILCVNSYDEVEYIIRTIKTIEGISACKVIALGLYPLAFKNQWLAYNHVYEPLNGECLDEVRGRLEQETGLPVYRLGDEKEVEALCDRCIDFLAE